MRFREWLEDELENFYRDNERRVLDEEGNPKVVHHGTNEKFDRFEAGEFGFHFGDENAAQMMGDSGSFLLRITNPLRMKDLGVWDPLNVLRHASRILKIPGEDARRAENSTRELAKSLGTDLDQDDDMVLNRRAHYRWSAPVRELIKSLGHDGIVYRNEAEGFEDSYIAFDSYQIRRIP